MPTILSLASLVAMTATMLLIGWFAWKRLQRQEEEDPVFRDRLRHDDERADRGLRGDAGESPRD